MANLNSQRDYLTNLKSTGSAGEQKWANQGLYLDNLRTSGSAGQQSWANQQLKQHYGADTYNKLYSQPQNTVGSTGVKQNNSIAQTQNKPTLLNQPTQSITSSIGNNSILSGQPTQQKPNQFKFQTYDPTQYKTNDAYLKKASEFQIGATKDQPYAGFIGNQYEAGALLDQAGLNELAYYLELQDNTYKGASSAFLKAKEEEMSKNRGLVDGWATNYSFLSDAFSQQWALEDFLADKYGMNSMSDYTEKGISRADLGFRYGGETTTLEERIEQGIKSDPWGINNDYFNDPRNKGQKFSYMDYFDPTAYANQNASAEDGRGIEYYYNTNFAREHGYEDDSWDYNTNHFLDWRDLSHDQMVGKYGYGGSNWFGTEENLQAYKQMVQQILSGGGGGGSSNQGSYNGYLNSGGSASSSPSTPVLPTSPSTNPTTYTPGLSSGVGGYADNQLIQNELFQRYLKEVYGGGF